MTQQETIAQNGNNSIGSNDKANQNDKNLQTILVAVVGIVGVAGSLTSTIVTNKHNITKDKKGREADAIRDKLNILSMIIYHLRSIANSFLDRGKVDKDKMTERKREIEDTIRGKLYLLNPNVIKEWIQIRTDLEFGDANLALVSRIYEVMEFLINDYNNTAIQYKGIVNADLQRISKGELECETKDNFQQQDTTPEIFNSNIRVYDKLQYSKGISRAVIKGEIKEPKNNIRLETYKTDPEGICRLKVITDDVGKYTLTCKVYADGYETKSFITSFEKR